MTRSQQPLRQLLQQLHIMLNSIPVLESQGYKPPIIDGDGYAHSGDLIIGLRIFRDAVSREVEVLERFLAKSDREDELSTNASYFVAVWNEIMTAPPPIVAIGKIIEPLDGKKKKKAAVAGSARPGGIKIDVVADEGRKWIRVNTMKNSRILAEFREMDSYLTGSEDESDDEGAGHGLFEASTADQDNSLLRMGRALAAASAIPIPGTNEKPSVTLRLTRLKPDPLTPSDDDEERDSDPRISQTIDALRGMGLNVQLGERAFQTCIDDDGGPPRRSDVLGLSGTSPRLSVSPGPMRLYPTRRMNMDLSMLIALVSDLSHAELPCDEEGAWARFRMPASARAWKLGKSRCLNTSGTAASARAEGETALTGSEEEVSKHARALSMQCIQEMKRGLVDEVVGRLRGDTVEFWTTEEARDRCIQIVEKIGGDDERRRARAMFAGHGDDDIAHCQEEFWRGSRHPASYFPSLLPIRIHGHERCKSEGRVPRGVSSSTLFWGHLIQTCRYVLSDDDAPHPRLYRKDGEMERAKVTRVNTKLTVHTVASMLIGACEGMTTLTANRASVRALMREMKGVRHGYENAGVGEVDGGGGGGGTVEDSVDAAIWIVEPRSLAEGMRADRL